MLPSVLKKIFIVGAIAVPVLSAVVPASYRKLPDKSKYAASEKTDIHHKSMLVEHLQPQITAHPGKSGIQPLREGRDAFLARVALAQAAQSTLDVQYYIWHDDISGRLLLQNLYQAAQRGVRVRLLLDDNNTKGMDGLIAALNAHPNIQVRLFNPFMQRNHRLSGYLSDFSRLNRRMHNKSFTADGAVSIVGGRNIGDEYFDAGSGVMFADLDVAAVGEAANAIQQDFERYWAAESVYPAEAVITAEPEPFDTRPSEDTGTQTYLRALAESGFAKQLKSGSFSFYWGKTTLVSDDPAKGLGKVAPDNTVLARIGPVMEAARQELLIVSPYFVPTQKGTDMIGSIAQNGGSVTVLTNSLAATDVAAVHSGYAKYRRNLLEAGVKLYELKPNATVRMENTSGLHGSSGASLHAKTFAVDKKTLFVGSFNMDPRSAALNTEMGLIIENTPLAAELSDGLKQSPAKRAYAVTQTASGSLQWQTEENGRLEVYQTEPESSRLKRFTVWICSLLPIEWLL